MMSLIRIFNGCILDRQGCQISSCGQQRLIKLQAPQTDLCLLDACQKEYYLILQLILDKWLDKLNKVAYVMCNVLFKIFK